ncbi:metal-dependent transcriptional regulator [Geoglobus sp.]
MRYEDYLLVIYELVRFDGYTRVKDIADAMGVRPASVTEMLKKLSRMGYVNYVKRHSVRLTERGKQEAERILERRETLVKFLLSIGVPEEIALKDACLIEHTLNPRTVRQLKNFVRFIESSPRGVPKWLDHFRMYCETGTYPCVLTESNVKGMTGKIATNGRH